MQFDTACWIYGKKPFEPQKTQRNTGETSVFISGWKTFLPQTLCWIKDNLKGNER